MFVIHLRNGKVKSATMGGKCFVLPLLDEIITIPTTVQMMNVDIHGVSSTSGEIASISAAIFWRVIKPEIAYTVVSWDPKSHNFVDHIMNELATGVFIEEAAQLASDWQGTSWIGELKQSVAHHLNEKMIDWGIIVENIEIHVPGQENTRNEIEGTSSLSIREPGE